MRDPPLCKYIELTDGTYNINQLADMHEAMDAEAEYAKRVEEARKQKR